MSREREGSFSFHKPYLHNHGKRTVSGYTPHIDKQQ